MTRTTTAVRAANLALIVLLIAAVVYVWTGRAGAASNLPADKMTVTGSKTVVQAPNSDAVLLTAKMKTSTPADLLLQVAAECTILSQITNTGSETQAYTAKIDVWAEVDGKPVPVVPPPSATGASGAGSTTSDDGRVVFCNREFQRTTVYDAENESIKDMDNTTQANGFNWVALNVGNGIHTVVVKAHFTDTNGADTFAHGVIGGRTLIAEPTNYFISQP